jgi:hypothetical protein
MSVCRYLHETRDPVAYATCWTSVLTIRNVKFGSNSAQTDSNPRFVSLVIFPLFHFIFFAFLMILLLSTYFHSALCFIPFWFSSLLRRFFFTLCEFSLFSVRYSTSFLFLFSLIFHPRFCTYSRFS